MPPAAFIASATCSFSTVGGRGVLTFLTPSTVASGDTLLSAVTSFDSVNGAVDVSQLPSGWSALATFISTPFAQIATLLRRIATDTEPPSHSITLVGITSACGALLVYRGLDAGAGIVAGDISDVVTSTAFVCPSLTLTTYSDLYLGIAWISNGSAPVIPPSGTLKRLDAAQAPTGAPCELAVFELLKEATGPTGTQTATTVAAHNGLAAAIALKTLPPLPAPAITPDIPGAIGFVTVGV